MNKFIEDISEILEVDAEIVKLESNFREDFPDWDSMKGFAIICLLEDDYSVQIDVKTFLECKTLSDLLGYVEKK